MTSTTTDLRGILTALATPFDADENIDTAVLKQLVDRSAHPTASRAEPGSRRS